MLLLVGVLVILAAVGGAFDDRPGAAGGPGDNLPAATKPLEGTIKLGEARSIGGETSDPGIDLTLTAPAGGPAPGLALHVPGEAYGAPVDFALSARPVTVTGYGGKVAALSDLITVDNGGAYAASPMIVTIPVSIPDGMFAMGFFRHDDGTLEAMPLLDETPSSVTVATRHFSSFLVLGIAEAALPDNIGTGFRAGEDDFQAPNHGSYLSPKGHCSGQSIGAIWYFIERKANGAPQLYGLTDNLGRGGTIPFWQDDRSQFRLSSSIQQGINWRSLYARLTMAVTRTDSDRLQWDAFRYAMLVTGNPQLVGLEQTGEAGGHAIIAYAATPSGLWVADPNHPGKLRSIAWNAKAQAFDAYASGPTAAESDYMYDIIGLEAQTAFVEWDTVGALWAAVAEGTIGDDRYPTWSLQIETTAADGTTAWEPLRAGLIDSSSPNLAFSASSSGAPMRATFYNTTEGIGYLPDGSDGIVTLGHGINDLGVYVEAQLGKTWRFVDFQRFELVAPAPSGMPTVEPSMPETEPTYDCSVRPPGGIAAIDWSLHCEGIDEPFSP